jgi:hypothetical protein
MSHNPSKHKGRWEMRIRGSNRWPRPRREFTEELVRRLEAKRSPRTTRVALAAGFAAVGLLVFAGLGAASSTVSGVSGTIGSVVGSDQAAPSGEPGDGLAAANDQYEYPAWVCLTRVIFRRQVFLLWFSWNGRFPSGWHLFHYYGRHPGPCPPR